MGRGPRILTMYQPVDFSVRCPGRLMYVRVIPENVLARSKDHTTDEVVGP